MFANKRVYKPPRQKTKESGGRKLKIIALTNQKGGVAKTTTALTLAAGLAERGRRVLMVDMDAQSNLSLAAGVNLFDMPYTLYDVFKGTVPDGLPGIIREVKPGLKRLIHNRYNIRTLDTARCCTG